MNLRQLLTRGDQLAIESGRLTLTPLSGKQEEADNWLASHREALTHEILALLPVPLFRFVGHSTGFYGKHKAGGVTLQFAEQGTGELAYVTFNADITRSRSSKHGKKGSRLPAGRFVPPAAGAFVVFWRSARMPLPRRPSEYHEHIGKLKRIIFTGALVEGSKLNKDQLKPLEVDYQELVNLYQISPQTLGKGSANSRQVVGNSSAKLFGKQYVQSQYTREVQTDFTACAKQYGSRLTGTRLKDHALEPDTVDDWLVDYDQAEGL